MHSTHGQLGHALGSHSHGGGDGWGVSLHRRAEM